MYRIIISGLLLLGTPSIAQLLGHFNVAKHKLPEGFQYRDTETVKASQLAAWFGERFQVFADERSEEKRRRNNFISPAPNFQTVFQNVNIELR